MQHADFQAWVERYLVAWASDDPEDVAALFAEDATYATSPWSTPWIGREAIVAKWIEHGDSQTEWSFTWDVVAVENDVGIVQGETTYEDHTYRNLWIVRLDPDGLAREFTEWYAESPATRKKA
jgi:uncharacterized protein (TIGR02246 family)